jgi:hypothetical protein
MTKVKIFLYAIFAIAFQVVLGQLTGQGQGGIGMLTFLIIMELDPNYSFTYLLERKASAKDKD